MPFTAAFPAVEPFKVTMSSLDLLTTKEGFNEDWDVEFGKTKAFYVRGATWYRKAVVDEVTRLARKIEDMKKHLGFMQDWGSDFFDWESPFSHVQIRAAWNKEALSFDKAAQVILLCAYAAESLHRENSEYPSGQDVLDQMRIEPAVYRIPGLDSAAYAKICENSNYGSTLQSKVADHGATAQKNPAVFEEMAMSHTVTLRLAVAVRECLLSDFPEIWLGNVEIPDEVWCAKSETIDLRA